METGRPIGGWLIYFAIRTIISFVYGIFVLFVNFDNVANFNYDDFSSDIANIRYVQAFYPFTAVVILLLIESYLAYLFFTKNKDFPKAYIYLNITDLVICLSLEYVIALSGEVVYFSRTIAAFIWLIIWGTYLVKSQRVKETFINTKRKKYVKITEEEYELIKQKLTNQI
ncbi:DUF2569 family protein [Neobacillus sp. OS1-33]|uniref:DUF2569 family protein n=1 Tax=Neobacillus sp. OS1-33 TaxID=3070683 RepID=UPI0027E03A0B|nr:DUF2569 family protein [Neobacillus sp. OS1-33]WML26254.1 DUF2569 family protein [Neobacillus sp. OS1-33]